MADKKHDSLEGKYNEIASEVIEDCIFCGECIRNCTTFKMTPISGEEPEEIMQKMVDLLKDGVSSEEAYIKTYTCSGCGNCKDICPQDLDPLLIHEAAKIALTKSRAEPPEAMRFGAPHQDPPDLHSMANAFKALQIKPSQIRWLQNVPSEPEKVESVLFMGCGAKIFPHKTFAILDIFDRMGLNYIAIEGGDLCCGSPSFPIGGQAAEAEVKFRELVDGLKAFSPKRVILICPSCYRQFTEGYSSFIDTGFETHFYSQFLLDHLDKIELKEPLNKTVTFHQSCQMTRSGKESGSTMKLLKAIPGLKIVDMEDSEDKRICCGGGALTTYPPIGQKLGQILIEKVARTGADYVVNVCSGCDMCFLPGLKMLSFGITDIADLINEAMGGKKYENRIAEYFKCESVEEVLEQSKECIKENSYTEEEMRNILSFFFVPRKM